MIEISVKIFFMINVLKKKDSCGKLKVDIILLLSTGIQECEDTSGEWLIPSNSMNHGCNLRKPLPSHLKK